MGVSDEVIATLFAEGQKSWSAVGLALDGFHEFVRRLATDEVPAPELAGDLFLAAACAAQVKKAIEEFDQTFLGDRLVVHLARFKLPPDQLDEVRQELRIRLLAPPTPRILSYSGRAPLDAWVHVIAVRLVLDRLRSHEGRTVPDSLGNVMAQHVSVERVMAKARVAGQFQRALDYAISGLDAKRHTLLRLHFVDGLSLDEMGAFFRVHRATVARWLVAARRDVYDTVRTRLGLELAPNSSEFRDLVNVAMSEVHISLARPLAR